jgi:hypothetical protein
MDSPGANPLSGWSATFSPGSASYKSMKRPDGWNDLYNAALATTKLDPALAKKCEDALYNDSTEIWLYYHGTSWAVTDNVMDSGVGTRGAFIWWEPQNLWLKR